MSIKILNVCFGLTLIGTILALAICYIAFPSHIGKHCKDWTYFYGNEAAHKQNFRFTLSEQLKCKDREPFLVVLVSSAQANVKARQAIRITWGSQKSWWGNQVLTLFLVGKGTEDTVMEALSIEDESILYGDIIQQDFVDTYDNLTLKTIMAFRWLTEFCSNVRYVMKTDMDVFINVGNLVKLLLNSNASENFITGYPLIENQAYRGFYGKNSISYDEYACKVYPPYLSGLGYVLDMRLARKVYEVMSHVKPIKIEDAYVGICLKILGVNITIPADPELFFLYRIDFDVCKYKHLIAVHGISPEEMITIWQKLTNETSVSCH